MHFIHHHCVTIGFSFLFNVSNIWWLEKAIQYIWGGGSRGKNQFDVAEMFSYSISQLAPEIYSARRINQRVKLNLRRL